MIYDGCWHMSQAQGIGQACLFLPLIIYEIKVALRAEFEGCP